MLIDEQNGLSPCSRCRELVGKLESNNQDYTRFREEYANLREEKDELLEELRRVNENPLVDLYKTTFVPSRHGIGYEPDRPKESDSPLLKWELNECRAPELQCKKQKNAKLEEKIWVLESGFNGKKEYFTGNNGHKIYVQIAKGSGSRVYNKETMDRNRI